MLSHLSSANQNLSSVLKRDSLVSKRQHSKYMKDPFRYNGQYKIYHAKYRGEKPLDMLKRANKKLWKQEDTQNIPSYIISLEEMRGPF